MDCGRRLSVTSNGLSAFNEFIDSNAVEQRASANPQPDQSSLNQPMKRRPLSFPEQTPSPPSTPSYPRRLRTSAASDTPSSPYRVPQFLCYTAKIQPPGSLSSLPAELWLEIFHHLDIRSTEHLLSALFFLIRALGICPPTVRGRTVPHLRAWLRNGGALYEILTKYPLSIAEDIFAQLSGQEKVTFILTLYTLDTRPTKQATHTIQISGFEFLLPFTCHRWSHSINKHTNQGRMRDWEMFENEQWSVERAADGRKGAYVRVWKKARPKSWRSR